MKHLIDREAKPERALLIGIEVRNESQLLSLEDSLTELALLADTAGLIVVGTLSQRVSRIDPATFIGSGKVEEVQERIQFETVDVLIFDDELSPRHQRELEKRFGEVVRVIDRSALILDIFAQHAKTHEGALQVELAQYEYRLPRLTRLWSHLARQAGGGSARGGSGGVGLRGPGETQLEVDQREINTKITKLRSDLEKVRQNRLTHRKRRKKNGIPVIALVGYTNAGKSTLLQSITNTETYIADQLFATLDPLTRKTQLPSGREILMSDTVGFIQKLPTTLIAAFRATLEEVTEADLVLHVVDVSHPNAKQHIETVEDTLAQIDMPAVPRILVWNKCDLLSEGSVPDIALSETYKTQILVSASDRIGLEALIDEIELILDRSMYHVHLLIPYADGQVVSRLFEQAHVESQEHLAEGIYMSVQVSASLYGQVAQYQIVE